MKLFRQLQYKYRIFISRPLILVIDLWVVQLLFLIFNRKYTTMNTVKMNLIIGYFSVVNIIIIGLSHMGEAIDCDDVCQFAIYSEYRGSDGKLYPNCCYLRCCQNDRPGLDTIPPGLCDEEPMDTWAECNFN